MTTQDSEDLGWLIRRLGRPSPWREWFTGLVGVALIAREGLAETPDPIWLVLGTLSVVFAYNQWSDRRVTGPLAREVVRLRKRVDALGSQTDERAD